MAMPRLSAESALYHSRAHYHSLAAGPAPADHLDPVGTGPCSGGEFALCAFDEAALPIPGTCTMTVGTSERVTDFRTVSGNLTLVGQSRAALRGIDTQLTFAVQQAGETVLQVDSTLSPTGTYTTNWHYGSMVKGVRDATLVTKDGKVIGGAVDGHTLKSFTRSSRAVTLADGTPVPQPIFPPGMHNALALMQTAVKRTLSSCTAARGIAESPRHSLNQLAITPASNGTSTFGSPPGIDDTSNTTSCNTCIAEADAAAATCTLGCGVSFGFNCGCIAGIPFLYLNCHTVGEQFGQGCCPVACGPSQTILNVGVVYQCCYGGDSCFAPGAPVVGGSSTAAFCCGPGLQPCNQSICCPSDAPCRDVGICCPTNQNTCITNNGPVCCNEGENCIQNVGCCPPDSICGNNCCDSSSRCVDPNTGTCCPLLTGIPCGNQCCDGSTQRCTSNGCCPIAQACNGFCCQPGSICAKGQCISSCPDGEDFSTAPDGTATCCPLYQCDNPSNDNICVENSCPGGVCCRPNQVCCPSDIPGQYSCSDPPC